MARLSFLGNDLSFPKVWIHFFFEENLTGATLGLQTLIGQLGELLEELVNIRILEITGAVGR